MVHTDLDLFILVELGEFFLNLSLNPVDHMLSFVVSQCGFDSNLEKKIKRIFMCLSIRKCRMAYCCFKNLGTFKHTLVKYVHHVPIESAKRAIKNRSLRIIDIVEQVEK